MLGHKNKRPIYSTSNKQNQVWKEIYHWNLTTQKPHRLQKSCFLFAHIWVKEKLYIHIYLEEGVLHNNLIHKDTHNLSFHCWTHCQFAVLKQIQVFDVSLLSVLTKSLLCMKRTPSGLQKRQQTFLSLIFFFFSKTDIHRVKRGKHDCMVNRAFVFLSSTFIFLFTNKRNFILVIFFFPVILFFWQSPFVATRMCLKCILQNWKCELLFFHLSGFLYLVLFVLLHPTIGLTNGDTSKAFSNWHFATTNPLWYQGIVTSRFYSGRASFVILVDILLLSEPF